MEDNKIDLNEYFPSKAEKKCLELLEYIRNNPSERFMQALRNYLKVGAVMVSAGITDTPEDTFYWPDE